MRRISASWFFLEDEETRPDTGDGPTAQSQLHRCDVRWCPELEVKERVPEEDIRYSTSTGAANIQYRMFAAPVDVWQEEPSAGVVHLDRISFQSATFDSLVRRLARMNKEAPHKPLVIENYKKLKAENPPAAVVAPKKKKKTGAAATAAVSAATAAGAGAAATTVKVQKLIHALTHYKPMAIEPVCGTRRYRSMMLLLLGSSRTLEATRGGGALPTAHMLNTLSAAERVEAKTTFIKRVCSVRLITAERKTKMLIYQVRLHLCFECLICLLSVCSFGSFPHSILLSFSFGRFVFSFRFH